MSQIELYFDGYCPESLLKNKEIEMKLNEDDFWESEGTGLQISIFPPYATILKWRGKGKFRQSADIASNVLTGLVLTGAQNEEGKEIFPDEKNVISNKFDLEWYLDEIYKSREEFEAAKFNPNDPIFEEQKRYLKTLSKQDLSKLFNMYEQLKSNGYITDFMSSEQFQEIHKLIYDLKLIFNFKWMAWHCGRKNIDDTSFDYTATSLLDLSMYLTAIFRADRFSEGTIEKNFRNGTLDKILRRLKDERSTTYI